MKIIYLLVLLAIFSVAVFGCNQNSGITTTQNKEKSMEVKQSMMAEEGFELENGTMYVVNEKTKTQTLMEKNAVLNDGTKVMTSGKVVKKDGSTVMLMEGESIWMDGSVLKAGEMMKGEMMESSHMGKVLAGTTSKYIEFNKEDYDKALKENKTILLYFYASWCPICKIEQPETMAAFNELNNSNLVGFRVHYNDGEDNADAKALAQQFQIPYQHTKVIIKDGKQVLKAPDSWDKQRYLTELAKV